MGFGSNDLESCVGMYAHHLEAFWNKFETKKVRGHLSQDALFIENLNNVLGPGP